MKKKHEYEKLQILTLMKTIYLFSRVPSVSDGRINFNPEPILREITKGDNYRMINFIIIQLYLIPCTGPRQDSVPYYLKFDSILTIHSIYCYELILT